MGDSNVSNLIPQTINLFKLSDYANGLVQIEKDIYLEKLWAGLAFKPINHHRAHDAITVPYNDHKQSIIQHINRLQKAQPPPILRKRRTSLTTHPSVLTYPSK
ncbi:hypothetical protein OUZ56_016466 [Daphnia magna]|uniref:Uncharacterized protein n=1 Tax=Daphnia magna TaxID=35525 RepID=A0ABR0AQL9_9CRUS|nr:hypothetical protein OUZ56_016466 [Daphnia magna]